VLFRNAYTPAASCNPVRSAIFAGIPPYASGLYHNLQKLRDVMPNEVLLPRHFSNHGYWSAGSGKMLHYIIDPPSWDDYFPAREKDNPFPATYDPRKRPVSLPRGGAWQYIETDWGALDISDKEYGGDWSVSKWIGEQLHRKQQKPRFLACGIYRPHEPWFVPKKYFEPFPLETIQLPPGYLVDDLDDVPPAGRKIARNRYFPHILWHGQWRNAVQAYLASIHFADAMLGRVLDALDQSPSRENTIVVLWSDHGWHLGEKEHWQKYTAWRACDRVPLMIRVPRGVPGLPEGTKPGTICDRPVSLMDLFGTLTDLCGVPEKPGIQSRSLAPLLRDAKAEWPHVAITHLGRPQDYAISGERFRYIHYAGGDEELYDIVSDRYEWTNLVARAEFASQLAELRAFAPANPAPVFESQAGVAEFVSDATVNLMSVKAGGIPKSSNSKKQVNLLFQNKRQGAVKLVWINQGGERAQYGTIDPASQRLMRTFAGHLWLVLDAAGKELGCVRAGENPVTVLIE
jgi:arylsulfatase A-like enzyme